MKANQVPAEVLLRGIAKEDWGLGWEAIEIATKRNLAFATQGRLFAFIKTTITRKKFQEDFYHRRHRAKDECGNPTMQHFYIRKSLPVTELLHDSTQNHDDYIANAIPSGSDFSEEVILRTDLLSIGFPPTFIDMLLLGEPINEEQLTGEELELLARCRSMYMRTKRR